MRANANAIRQQPNLITAGNCRRRTRLIVAYDYAGIRSRSLSCFDFPLFFPSDRSKQQQKERESRIIAREAISLSHRRR